MSGDIFVLISGGDATGIQWLKPEDAAKHPSHIKLGGLHRETFGSTSLKGVEVEKTLISDKIHIVFAMIFVICLCFPLNPEFLGGSGLFYSCLRSLSSTQYLAYIRILIRDD